MTGHPEPTVITIPDDFPVTWDHPDQVHQTWIQGRQHSPNPITPLTSWMRTYPWTEGNNRGFTAVNQPIKFEMARFNTYAYNTTSPHTR